MEQIERLQLVMEAKLKGISLSELAKECLGCSTSYLSQWQHLKTDLSDLKVDKLKQYISTK